MIGNWNSRGGHVVFPRWSVKAVSKEAWLKPVVLFDIFRLNRTKLPTWSKSVLSTQCVTAINKFWLSAFPFTMSVQNCWYLCTQNVPQIRCINCNIHTSCLSQFSLISILLNINKASKHCNCRQTIMNAYGQCIETDRGVFQISTFRFPKTRFLPLFS